MNVRQEVAKTSTHQPLTMFHGAQISGGTLNDTVNTLYQSPTLPDANQSPTVPAALDTATKPDSKRRRYHIVESDTDSE